MNFGHFLTWLNFYLFHAKSSPAIFGAGILLTTSSSPTTSFAAFVTSVAISSLLITEGTPQSISTSVDPRKVAAVHLASLLFDHGLTPYNTCQSGSCAARLRAFIKCTRLQTIKQGLASKLAVPVIIVLIDTYLITFTNIIR